LKDPESMVGTADLSRAAATRARLLAAALEAFAARGFHGTTTRDIAAAAGMSPAALYVHHRSKEELLHQITLEGNRAALALVQESLASSDDPVEQLHRFVRDFAAASARSPTVTQVINNELACLTPEHRSEIRLLRRQIGREVRGMIQRGVDAGGFDVSSPGIVATAVMSLGVDVARWYHLGGPWTPEDVGNHYARMAMRMLGASSPPPAPDDCGA
jgi:AcrR family transcriptional regulator